MINQLPLIQIIDDDPAVVLGLKRLLRASGMQIQTFASGEEFLTREKPKEADCIIIDIQMPGMTGLDVQAHLKQCWLPCTLNLYDRIRNRRYRGADFEGRSDRVFKKADSLREVD